jgi:hypothetical protein
MSHNLLTKTLTDGRTLEISYAGNLLGGVTAKINGNVEAVGSIDRRSTPMGAARMTKLPAEVVAIVAGKIALKAADLATIDAALAASPYAAAAKTETAKIVASVKREVALEREINAFAARLGAGEMHN